jgi:hypothetical protein
MLAVDNSGVFHRPFTTASITYIATGALTPISFTINAASDKGSNDPLIDGVAFELTAPGGVGAVPEPATWAMMLVGFGAVGGAMRRRRGKTVAFASA